MGDLIIMFINDQSDNFWRTLNDDMWELLFDAEWFLHKTQGWTTQSHTDIIKMHCGM